MKNMRGLVMKAGLFFFTLSLFLAVYTQAASFDCAKATTKVEKMICANAELSKLDDEMQPVYQDVYKYTADPAGLKIEQRHWLKVREACKDVACLAQVYRKRITDLKKTLTEPKPCFRLLVREWPKVASGHYPVCVDFLKNINKFCSNLPICEWKVDPSIKTLALPQWEELDPKAHLKLIQHMFQRYFKNPEEAWTPISPETLQRINEGRTHLWHAWFDLDRDGQKEHVVRFDGGSCNMQGVDFYGVEARVAVVNTSLSQVDSLYEYMGRGGMGIIIHDGLGYVVTRNGDGFDVQEPFSAREGLSKGMDSVCVFDYLRK